jgi:hypothetical protein
MRTTLPANTTKKVMAMATRVNRRKDFSLLWKGSFFCKMRHLD